MEEEEEEKKTKMKKSSQGWKEDPFLFRSG